MPRPARLDAHPFEMEALLDMRIYHPVRSVGGSLRENSFTVIDDAGVEIGQGGLTFRMLKKMFPERPLDIEMNMSAHPMASDTLYGALSARAERIILEHKGVPARLYTRCDIDDAQRREYFMRMGFDDYDGDELFALRIVDRAGRRRNYGPVGVQSIDVDLRTRTRREEFLIGLKEYGCVEHASEWLEERMRSPVFLARQMYYGSDFVGSILVTGTQAEATLDMVCTGEKWRGRGVASALVEEAYDMLLAQQVPYLLANAVRRNAGAMRLLRKCGFDWIRTDCVLLGKDLG